MEREYTLIGKKLVKDGVTYYAPAYYDDGLTFGTFYKDEKAFKEDSEAVCYIPEYGFDENAPVYINGEKYYKADDVDGYTRKMLTALLIDEDGVAYTDEEGNELDIEAFFESLLWAFPQTYLNELT